MTRTDKNNRNYSSDLSKNQINLGNANERKYPIQRKDYEKMMQHDVHRRVRGAIRQTRWADRD